MQKKRKLIIRRVTLEDAVQLQTHCFSAMSVEQVGDALQKTLEATASGHQLQLVAEVDHTIVGTATLIRDPHALRSHRAGLFSLVVHPAYQRHGIARQLVDTLAAHAQSLGIEILETSCRAGTAAEAVYPRLDFTEYGRLPRGLYQTWDESKVFDEVYFYRECTDLS